MAYPINNGGLAMPATQAEKVHENRVRRMAERQGLRLQKSRRRDPRALDYGVYVLIDNARNAVVSGESKSLADIERYLTGDRDGLG
jgi:hypothetical protein